MNKRAAMNALVRICRVAHEIAEKNPAACAELLEAAKTIEESLEEDRNESTRD